MKHTHMCEPRDNGGEFKVAGRQTRICILTTAHPALDVRIFHKQAKSLARAGYDVRLIAPHSKDEWIDGVKIIAVPKPRNRAERMLLASWRILGKALREKAHVYHFHDPDLIPVGICLKLFGSRVIYDVHEDYPESIKTKPWLPTYIRRVVASVFDPFEKICSCFFDAVIPATEDISRRFCHRNVLILHNYPVLQYAVDKVGAKNFHENHTMIYVGQLAKVRGIIEIVRSLEYVDKRLQVKLKLLGKSMDSDFEREIRAIEVFSEVEFVGLVPHEEVFSHLSAASIGLVALHPTPRYITSLPLKMFEYMSAGLPVIASNFPLWKQIVEDNNCGLTTDPTNPEKIARTIEYLLKRPELMKKMGENGRRAVLDKYNWEQESRKLLNLYAEPVKRMQNFR